MVVKMLLFHELYLMGIMNFRHCFFAGRQGSGKTLLAVLTAKILRDSYGYKVYSNIPLSFASKKLDVPVTDTVFVLDEAWSVLFSGVSLKTARYYFAFMRKLNNILLVTSCLPLSSQLFHFRVERYLNLSPVFLPVWIYVWKIGKGKRGERGYFWLLNPARYYSLYDHTATPLDDAGIGELLKQTAWVLGNEKEKRGRLY